MDPATTFCPNRPCPARGPTGQGKSGIQAQKEQRCLCHECHTTFSATTGTGLYRLRTAAETVRLIVPLLAHGCPVPAIVAAWGGDERTVAAGWARAGRQGQAVHEYVVEPPRDLRQGQADERRIKNQGGIVWRALAMRGQTRWWRGGEGSAPRDLPRLRRLLERVRRCAAHRPLLLCTDGVRTSIRALRETLRAPGQRGTGGRPRLRPWRNLCIAPGVTRDERRRDAAKRLEWRQRLWPTVLRQARQRKALLLCGAAASFAQWGSLRDTWAPKSHQPAVPTRGIRTAYQGWGRSASCARRCFAKAQPGRGNSANSAAFWLAVLAHTTPHIFVIHDGARDHTSTAMEAFVATHGTRVTQGQLPAYAPDCQPMEERWQKVKKLATHLKDFPEVTLLQAAVDKALLHLAQTPQEIMSLMTRYCDSLGALAASWRTKLFLKSY